MNGVLADFSLAVEQIPDSWLSHKNSIISVSVISVSFVPLYYNFLDNHPLIHHFIGAAGKIFARILMLLKGPIVQMNGVLADFSLAECSLAVEQIPDSWLSHNNFHYISFCYISFLCSIILQFSGQSSSDTALICRECFI